MVSLCSLRALAALTLTVWMGGTGCVESRAARRCVPGAASDSGVLCPERGAPRYRIPFPAGREVRVNQGFHDNPTHAEAQSYAIDFDCEPGEPIVAARSGVVWWTRRDSTVSCGDDSCVGQDNFVIVDHGDGTRAGYHHLAHMGVTVQPGEQVCRGQIVGLCGATGYATAPHLHWNVTPLWSHTLPARFEEGLVTHGHPYLLPEVSYVSRNVREVRCGGGEASYSMLPREAFAHRGVLLKRPLATAYQIEEALVVEGVDVGPLPRVAVSVRADGGTRWVTRCVEKGRRGRFRATIDWEEQAERAPLYWLFVTGAEEGCAQTRWAWSYALRVMGWERAAAPVLPRDAPRGVELLRSPD